MVTNDKTWQTSNFDVKKQSALAMNFVWGIDLVLTYLKNHGCLQPSFKLPSSGHAWIWIELLIARWQCLGSLLFSPGTTMDVNFWSAFPSHRFRYPILSWSYFHQCPSWCLFRHVCTWSTTTGYQPANCMGLFSVRHRGWDLRSYLRQISGICRHEVWTCVNDRGHWAFLGSLLIPFFSASKGQFKAGYMGEALITSKIFCTLHPKKTSWNLGIRRSAEIQTIEALSLKSPSVAPKNGSPLNPHHHPCHSTPPVPPKSDDNHDKGFPLQKAWETQQQFYQNTWETLWLVMEHGAVCGSLTVSRSCILLFCMLRWQLLQTLLTPEMFKPLVRLVLVFLLVALVSSYCCWCCGRGFWRTKNSFAKPSGWVMKHVWDSMHI